MNCRYSRKIVFPKLVICYMCALRPQRAKIYLLLHKSAKPNFFGPVEREASKASLPASFSKNVSSGHNIYSKVIDFSSGYSIFH